MEVNFRNFTTRRVSDQHGDDSGPYFPKEWSREMILKLIELFKEKRILWDTNDIEFKNRTKKHNAWVDLGAEMGIDAMEVEKKMRMLIGQFRRELKRGKCDDRVDSPYKSKWAFFNNLMFLKIKNESSYSYQTNASSANDNNDVGDTSCNMLENEPQSIIDVQSKIREARRLYMTRGIGRRSRMEALKRKTDAVSMGASVTTKKDWVKRRDEFDVFGEHVANTLRNLHSRLIQSHSKFEISNVLYRAEIDDHKQQAYNTVDPAIISGTATPYSFTSTPIPSNLSTSTENND